MRKMKMENKVTMGQMLKVANKEKKATANDKYIALHIEDENGENERCLLFTEIEIADIEKVKFSSLSDAMKFGRIYKANIDKKDTNLIKVKNLSGEEMILRLSPFQLERADDRRIKNPEDLPKKGFLTDLMD